VVSESRRPSRAALNWVDYLVIAATALTFLVVVLAHSPHSRKTRTSYLLRDTSPQTGLMNDTADLVAARIKVATRVQTW
jgi:hypothetical protein